ncbi:MAG: hypothetical protein BAJALOKI3v1_880018 [Promethearchaeota archaeon]|nr:MAG: hypothetical protein BAJALOKI3v1_880018 [Candidatus Lokiarchaeota archaeon]
MPKGFIITKWTEDKGLVVQIKYPESISVDLDDMMRIFYAHITGAGEAGNVFVRLEKARSNVSSHFTGMESDNPYMINLMLELGEYPEIYGEKILEEINQDIINYLSQIDQNPENAPDLVRDLVKYLKDSLFLLERLENLSKEQKLAQIYSGEKTRTILDILQERARSKRELQGVLEQKLGRLISNLDIVLDPFVKTDMIRQDWVEGSSDILLFLKSDFAIMRIPPEKIVELAKENKPDPKIAEKYLETARNFFKDYEPNEEDNLKIASIMINPDIYDYIVLFREKPYPLKKIPKGPGESFETISALMRRLEENGIITVLEDKTGMKWVFLLTDVIAEQFYPEYLIEKIRQDFVEGILKKDIAIKHLDILENAYSK